MDATLSFFTGQLDGELLADQRICTPQPGRRVLVRLADTKVAFIKPDDPNNGPLGNFLTPPSSGVYALVWRVEDEAMAESFFQKNGLRTTREDSVSTGFAIDPHDFFDARHEFVKAQEPV